MGAKVLPLYSVVNGVCNCSKGKNCKAPGKHPAVRGGWRAANSNLSSIPGNRNIGIATGSKSGIVIVDIDPRNGGTQSFSNMIKSRKMPPTTSVSTGGGGLHYYFRVQVNVPSKVLAPGIDFLSTGKLAVLPPATHFSGKKYHWLTPPSNGIAAAPQWLLDMVMLQKGQTNTAPQHNPTITSKIMNGFAPGSRNAKLASIAGTMRLRDIDETTISIAIHAINQAQCKPPLSKGEVDKIVQSICRYAPEEPLTDLGNARRAARVFGQDIKYLKEKGEWAFYNGQAWEEDNSDSVISQMVKRVPDLVYLEGQTKRGKHRKKYNEWAVKSQSAAGLRNCLEVLRTEPSVALSVEKLNGDPFLFNAANGVIDLSTGKLYQHDKSYLQTKTSPVMYEPKAKCPNFLKFMDTVFASNPNMINYMQKVLGWSLTADVRHQQFYLIHGPGANGKSTMLEIIRHIAGEYCMGADFGTFTIRNKGAASSDIARLHGARMVIAQEGRPGETFNESFVQQWTGGDPIIARFMYQDFFEFKPVGKLWLSTNHAPRIRTNAMWRRIRIIPMKVVIPKAQRDPHLKDKLLQEAPGILQWLIRGAIAAKVTGLNSPVAEQLARDEYRNRIDITFTFLSAKCVLHPSQSTTIEAIYQAYRKFCVNRGLRTMTQPAFISAVEERGYIIEGTAIKGVGLA